MPGIMKRPEEGLLSPSGPSWAVLPPGPSAQVSYAPSHLLPFKGETRAFHSSNPPWSLVQRLAQPSGTNDPDNEIKHRNESGRGTAKQWMKWQLGSCKSNVQVLKIHGVKTWFRGAELLTGNTLGLLFKRSMMLGKQTGLSKPNMLGLHRAHQYNVFFFFF